MLHVTDSVIDNNILGIASVDFLMFCLIGWKVSVDCVDVTWYLTKRHHTEQNELMDHQDCGVTVAIRIDLISTKLIN